MDVMSNPAVERLGRLHGGRVLDVATGSGDFALFLARTLAGYDEIVGIDNRPEALGTAAGRNLPRDVSFARDDATRLSFRDGSFDTVAVADSLHHLSDLPAALAEMQRVLRPGGTLVIAEMVADGLAPAQQTHDELHRLIAELNRARGIPHNPTLTRAGLTALYRGLGLNGAEIFEVLPDAAPTHDPDHGSEFLARFPRQLAAARGLPGFADWQRRAGELLERVRKTGIQPPTRLWLIGTR